MKDANFLPFSQYRALKYLWSKCQEGRDGAWVLTTRYTQLDYLFLAHGRCSEKKKLIKERIKYISRFTYSKNTDFPNSICSQGRSICDKRNDVILKGNTPCPFDI